MQIWKPVLWNGGDYFLLAKQCVTGIQYAPLYIHSFRLIQPPKITEAAKVNLRIKSLEEADTIADKLRWIRHQHGLLQSEVAERVNIDRGTYNGYERVGVRDFYPAEVMEAIANLYNIEVEWLLDDYNLFLYRGQASQIKALREARGMTQSQYSTFLGVNRSMVQSWERKNYVRITKANWKLIMDKEGVLLL